MIYMQAISGNDGTMTLQVSFDTDTDIDIDQVQVQNRLAQAQANLPTAVKRLTDRWPLGVASSSNRELIDRVLEVAGLAPYFRATVSSEEVTRGKPAPDVYLEAARRVGVEPHRAVAIEDSANGIRSAHAAGMHVVAIPNRAFPPPPDVLARAAVVLQSIKELDPEVVKEAERPSIPSSG